MFLSGSFTREDRGGSCHKSSARAERGRRALLEGRMNLAGRRGAGHLTSIAWASKALGTPGGVSVEVRGGREVRLRSCGLERTDLSEEEAPARDAGQWPSRELGGRKRTSS